MEIKEELKVRLQKALDMNEKKPIDLSKDLDIPKSAISQYLSGSSKNMPSPRLFSICKYLNVSEAWMMGYDVPMHRPPEQIQADKSAEMINSIQQSEPRSREILFEIVEGLLELNIDELIFIKSVVNNYKNVTHDSPSTIES